MWKMHRFYATPAKGGTSFSSESAAGRRRDTRKPLYDVDALIFAKDLARPLRSMVRDISKSGARLELSRGMKVSASPTYVPERMTVYFCPDKTEVECRLAWRDGRHFGVRFLGEIARSKRKLA